ncbi:MAG TPA: glycosyltransferase family 87 protein, partial [Dehalococcoidia bacterium]|nr:glycosyltransferase family 87 protein [Dehalococcoidia bacterium]
TFYPPLSQLVFAAGYLISPSPFTLRLFSVLFHLLSIGVLILILKELRLDGRYSIVYAWSPLATIEFANSGHIDSLAILLTLLSFFALLKRNSALSSAALGLGVLAKFYPLLFAVLFLPRWGRKGALVFAGVVTACYLPFLGAGAGLFQGFSYFMGRGLFNGSLFPLLSGSLATMMEKPDALLVSKALVGAIFLGFLAYLVYSYARSHQQEGRDLLLLRYSFWLVGAFLLLSPTVHPWYLTWVLPFLCLFRSAGWILLTGTVILARSIYIGYEAAGTWQEIGWVRAAEYAPPYLLMLYGLVRSIGERRKGSPEGIHGGKSP